MASLEQLRMLDDEETSTSSSDDEEQEVGPQRTSPQSAQSNAGTSSKHSVANASMTYSSSIALSNNKAVTMTISNAGGDGGTTKQLKRGVTLSNSGPEKKRIRLSLGGVFKRTNDKTTDQDCTDDRKSSAIHIDNSKVSFTPAEAYSAVTGQTTKSIKATPGIINNGGKKASSSVAISTKNNSYVTAPPKSTILSSRDRPKGKNKRSLPLKKKIKVVEAEVEAKSVPNVTPSTTVAATALPMDRVPSNATNANEPSGEAVEAVVIGHNEGNGEVDAVATVIAQPVKRKQARLPVSTKPKIVGTHTTALPTTPMTDSVPSTAKKRAVNVIRTVRLPPMSSPGLLIPPGSYRAQVNANGLVAPNIIFVQAMETAGYSTESRTRTPHRGSSVQREVGDMFDSDVKLCRYFPKLVPDELLGSRKNPTEMTQDESTTTKVTDDADMDSANGGAAKPSPQIHQTLPERLIRAFQSRNNCGKVTTGSNGSATPPTKGRKRRRILGFSDMAPLSLTLPHPDDYIQRRLAYFKKVNARENAIVDWQAEQEALEDAKERAETTGKEYSGPVTTRIVIPPIPDPPDPPRLSDMEGMDMDLFEQDQHPLYPPKNNLVSHLDKNAFHIASGRYFGLTCNAIADPHFVGPNCPGISGLNLSSSNGLATASSVGGAGLGGPLLVAPAHSVSFINTAPPTTTTNHAPSNISTKKSLKHSNASIVPSIKTPIKTVVKGKIGTLNGSSSTGPKGNDEATTTASTLTSTQPSKKGNGPPVTGSTAELRKVMEEGGEHAERTKGLIIREAVDAAIAGKHEGRPFRASNGKVYPDVSKAFASYAGMKPCMRCKSNKQGSYHCRLRRKHKDTDYDGGDSWSKLAPYFNMPMADQVIKPAKSKS